MCHKILYELNNFKDISAKLSLFSNQQNLEKLEKKNNKRTCNKKLTFFIK